MIRAGEDEKSKGLVIGFLNEIGATARPAWRCLLLFTAATERARHSRRGKNLQTEGAPLETAGLFPGCL